MRAGSESIAAVKFAEWSLHASSAGIAGKLRSIGAARACREALPEPALASSKALRAADDARGHRAAEAIGLAHGQPKAIAR